MPANQNPQLLSLLIRQCCELQGLLLHKAEEISALSGVEPGEVLTRIQYMHDNGEPTVEAFRTFEEDKPR